MTRKIMNKYDLDRNNIKIICTDRSKTEKDRSVAAIVEEEQEEGFYVSMDKRCSVHIAEIFAIAKAIQKNYNVNKNLIVYSDAKSAMEGLMDNLLSVYKNLYTIETRRMFFEYTRNKDKKIKIVWIPSHAGIKGNEVADNLAREETKEEAAREIKVPYNDLRENYKKEARTKSQCENIEEDQ